MKRDAGILILFFFLNVIAARADHSDDQLNAAYRQVLASNEVEAESLKWSELQWIIYRDAEANLQAWIVGKNAPDEAARKASLILSTQTRAAELQHIAKDGTSGDLSATVDGPDPLPSDQAYANLRAAVIAGKNPQLISALILDQKAWLGFSGLQADDDGGPSEAFEPNKRRMASFARLDKRRLAQLQADAALLKVETTSTPDSANESFADLNTEVSPDHNFRIEQTAPDNQSAQAWVISNTTGQRALLPQKNDETNVGRGEPTVAISNYAISPDDRWIFRTQKFYHGMDGAYLYERVSLNGLDYKSATPEPLDIWAWKFFQKRIGRNISDVKEGGVINFVSWSPGFLRISLNTQRDDPVHAADWRVDCDLKTKTFSIPPELQKHNRQAIR